MSSYSVFLPSYSVGEDCYNEIPYVTRKYGKTALDIIISTGIVSNFATHEGQKNPEDNYYYNSSLAHCVYYGSSLVPECEKHLHGEIVAFGALCLLTYDNEIEERDRILKFNKSIGLPITLDEIGMTEKYLDKLLIKHLQLLNGLMFLEIQLQRNLLKQLKMQIRLDMLFKINNKKNS